MTDDMNAPDAGTGATAIADAAPGTASGSDDSPQSYDVDGLAALLDSRDEENMPDDADRRDGEGDGLTEEREEKADENAAGEQGAESGKETVPFPTSWGAEAKEAFSRLPGDLREVVSKREAEREKYVAAKAEETAAERKKNDVLLKYAETELTSALQASGAVINAEFGNIDWARLQYEAPEEFMKLDALRKQRLASLAPALKQLEQVKAGIRAENDRRSGEEKERIVAEFKAVSARLPEIAGPDFNGKKFAAEATDYLRAANVPEEHINGINHGYQLELIAKAMRYDAMRRDAATAEKKVAAARPVMKPGAARSHESGKADSAWKRLRNNPDSTDAIAGLLDAMDG